MKNLWVWVTFLCAFQFSAPGWASECDELLRATLDSKTFETSTLERAPVLGD